MTGPDAAAGPGPTPTSASARTDGLVDLASRQAALVAALVTGGAPPPGFDPDRVAVARAALLRKRAGEVARAWPVLAATLRDRWPGRFVGWAADRPLRGGLRDGWDFARVLAGRGELPAAAATELAERDAAWAYDGASEPRRRHALARMVRRRARG